MFEAMSVHFIPTLAFALGDLIHVMLAFARQLGYPGIFLAMFLETIITPIPSEAIMPFAGFLAYTNGSGLIGVLFVATLGALGSTLGAFLLYLVSLKAGRFLFLKYGRYVFLSESKLRLAEVWFDKHGEKAVFFGRLGPLVRELISIPAGLSRMKLKAFLPYTFAGSFIWSTLLAYLGFKLGESWNRIDSISNIIEIASAGVILIVIIYLVSRGKPK